MTKSREETTHNISAWCQSCHGRWHPKIGRGLRPCSVEMYGIYISYGLPIDAKLSALFDGASAQIASSEFFGIEGFPLKSCVLRASIKILMFPAITSSSIWLTAELQIWQSIHDLHIQKGFQQSWMAFCARFFETASIPFFSCRVNQWSLSTRPHQNKSPQPPHLHSSPLKCESDLGLVWVGSAHGCCVKLPLKYCGSSEISKHYNELRKTA